MTRLQAPTAHRWADRSRKWRCACFDGDQDVTETGRGPTRVPGDRRPASVIWVVPTMTSCSPGDGWMRMGDICEIDTDGYLSVHRAKRPTSFCGAARNIRRGAGRRRRADPPRDRAGGSPSRRPIRCSAKRVLRLPRTRRFPDDRLARGLSIICWHWGFPRSYCRKRLIVLDELPRSSGGKIAKS